VKRYRIYEQVLDPGAALAGETAVDATAERQAPEAPA
jgi:hypothetical protein